MEAPWIAHRQEGAAQGKPEVQTPLAPAVERQGSEAATLARQGQHANRRDQPQDGASPSFDCEQGAARGHLTETYQPLAVQSAQNREEGETLVLC